MRHAPAEDRDRFPDDSLRPLSTQGRRKMARIARGIAALGIRPDVILSSPYARAVQTAESLKRALDLKKKQLVLCAHLAPGGNVDALISEVKGLYSLPTVLLVGHEPDMSELISVLITGSTSGGVTLKKGGMCCLDVTDLGLGLCASLEWLLAPAMLAAFSKMSDPFKVKKEKSHD